MTRKSIKILSFMNRVVELHYRIIGTYSKRFPTCTIEDCNKDPSTSYPIFLSRKSATFFTKAKC